MTVLPLVERELRVRARQAMTYWARCAMAAMATLVAVQSTLVYAGALGATALGSATFTAVSWLGFVLACGSALVTADSVSCERREGTLPLLLLTKLKGREVIFGKLAAAGLVVACALVGCLPTLGLALLAGGISGASMVRAELALMNALFVALAAGLWVSVRATTRRKALRNAIVATLVIQVVPWLLTYAFSRYGSGSRWLSLASPYTTFYLASDSVYDLFPYRYWMSLAISHAEGWLLIAWATSLLLKNWHVPETAAADRQVPMEPLLPQEAQALADQRNVLRQNDPVCWVVSRVRGHGALIWAGTLFLLLLGGTGFSLESLVVGSWLIPGATGLWNGLNLVLNLAAAALLAWGAGRAFYSAQRSGELELLLCTPMGARDIVGGHWRALCGPLRGAWLLLALLIFLQFFLLPSSKSPSTALGFGVELLQKVMVPINTVLDIVALCWVGMWFGLRCRKAFSVMGCTVGLVIGVPWIIAFLVDIFLSLAGTAKWSGPATAPAVLFWNAVSAILFLAKNIVLIRWAAWKLRTELRASASLGLREWLA
jgi:ABC-type transport system involved in multi-copper enzyme maturation permease subunit